MLRELASNLWVAERPFRFFGVDVGTRMTVIRLRDGGLFLHSPVSLDQELRSGLEALGSPKFAVAPNRFHHLFAGEYGAAYPGLKLFAAPGLAAKRPDLKIDAVLGDDAPPGWSSEIQQVLFGGYPLFNEVIFFHPSSRTLVTADLVFNFGSQDPPLTRLMMRLLGAYNRFGPTVIERLVVRDRAAARASLMRILEWDFERVIMCHGRTLESGGRQALRNGYAWLV